MRECILAITGLAWQSKQALVTGCKPADLINLSEITSAKTIQFVRDEKPLFRKSREITIATNADQWINYVLKHYNAVNLICLRLHDDDRFDAARFGGGSAWKLVCIKNNITELWMPIYTIQNRERHITYRHTHTRMTAQLPESNIPLALKAMNESLQEAYAFSLSHGLPEASRFADAIRFLDSDELYTKIEKITHRFISIPGYNNLSNDAQKILTACATGWVFGENNSWSRETKQAEAAQRKIGDRLYDNICNMIAIAACQLL